MENLTVYKASAGSGKTFTLAVEYIKLLVADPFAFRKTLAVTFTNKATEEMKMRILSQLYGIAHQLPSSQPYLKKIKEETTLADAQIRENAALALRLLIHNYSYFRVETIDAFFQTVLRNLAKELDLTANLRLELNDNQVEEEAVDMLIEELNKTSRLLHWILEYIQDNMDDDKSWNVIAQIKKFGMNIFKDYYKDHRKQLATVFQEKDFFKNYTARLRTIRKTAEETMKKRGEEFFEIIEAHGVCVDDFKSKKNGVCGYFRKLIEGEFVDSEKVYNTTAAKATESVDAWLTKANAVAGNPVYDLVETQLMPLLQTTENERKQQALLYATADLTLQHLNQLRLLEGIENKVQAINREVNRFMLSDTQALLQAMIDHQDSPFIFEKIGTQLENIMIDEFQDTSTVQWKNFKVLLLETMSRKGMNMIVGDVKQSIYRWRAGDWRLLNNIEEQFNPQMVTEKSLKTNYRSQRNIIAFNNTFFQKATQQLYAQLQELDEKQAQQVERAYQDVVQEIPAHKEALGMVEVTLFPKSEDYEVQTLASVVDKVDALLQMGVQEKDIAILVRKNDTIQTIGDYFLQHRPDIHLVSNEAFHLSASQAVNIIIQALSVLDNPDDILAKASLTKSYQVYIQGATFEAFNAMLQESALDELLPQAFITQKEQILGLPISEMVEMIYRIFELQTIKGQDAYICAFYDKLNEYTQDNIADIHNFLQLWENSLYKVSIQSSNNEGIKLVTIHKSKGLEYAHVLLPFCDWDLERNDSIVWCEPQQPPFSDLPVVPISYSKTKMLHSFYAKDYIQEYVQNSVDNLNLLYVAFTRAEQGLYVFSKKGDKINSRSKLIETCLDEVAKALGTAQITGVDDAQEVTYFKFGDKLPAAKTEEKQKVDNIFLTPAENIPVTIAHNDAQVSFRQSNSSEAFLQKGQETDPDKQKGYIQLGSILHAIFSKIRTQEDVPNALRTLEETGVLYDNIITKEKLLSLLHQRLADPRIAPWFTNRWTILNECTILRYNPDTQRTEERRPDRVMMDEQKIVVVDFKFGTPHAEHQQQVRDYIQLLSEMHPQPIEGYLWYIFSNQIIPVK